jgi:hypothetical protein
MKERSSCGCESVEVPLLSVIELLRIDGSLVGISMSSSLMLSLNFPNGTDCKPATNSEVC